MLFKNPLQTQFATKNISRYFQFESAFTVGPIRLFKFMYSKKIKRGNASSKLHAKKKTGMGFLYKEQCISEKCGSQVLFKINFRKKEMEFEFAPSMMYVPTQKEILKKISEKKYHSPIFTNFPVTTFSFSPTLKKYIPSGKSPIFKTVSLPSVIPLCKIFPVTSKIKYG